MKRCRGRLHDRKFQIFIFLIGYINVNKGVFCLIISYLRIKSYNLLNYNNCSTHWTFSLKFIAIVTGSDRKYNKVWIFLAIKFNLISIFYNIYLYSYQPEIYFLAK